MLEGTGLRLVELDRETLDRSRRRSTRRGSCSRWVATGPSSTPPGCAAPLGLPLLGVNLGRLGFLTELEASQVADGLRRYLAGDYRIDERTLVGGHRHPRGGGRRPFSSG